MTNLRLQSAVEYLTTYGWAIILVAVILAALYQLGFFSGTNFITTSCIAESGFNCQQPVMNITGYVEFNLGQISNGTITVTGVACTNTTANPTFTGVFANGSSTGLLQPEQTSSMVVQCPGIGSSGKIGSSFRGYIWIQYTSNGQSGLIAQIAVLSAVATTPSAFLPTAGTIYCVGATTAPYGLSYYAAISAGNVKTWKSTTSFPITPDTAGCSIYNGDIFCFGDQASAPKNVVYYAPYFPRMTTNLSHCC